MKKIIRILSTITIIALLSISILTPLQLDPPPLKNITEHNIID